MFAESFCSTRTVRREREKAEGPARKSRFTETHKRMQSQPSPNRKLVGAHRNWFFLCRGGWGVAPPTFVPFSKGALVTENS